MIGLLRWCGLFVPLALIGLASPAQTAAAPADPSASKATAVADAASIGREVALLVKQLGDEEYVVRETAAEKLTKIGLPARAALEVGSKDADREIRYRCERILALVRQTDFAQRLEAFSTDRDSDNDHGLPGWRRFRKLLGDDVASRALFVEMIKADPETLAEVERDPKAVGETLVQRLMQLQQTTLYQANQLPLGNIAALLFISIDDDVRLPTQGVQMMSSVLQQQSFHNVMQGGSRREILAKMLGLWIKRSDDFNLNQAMYLAMVHNIPEGLNLAERVLKKQGRNTLLAQPYIRQQAILAAARLGSAEHMPLIEPFLDDKSVVFAKQQNFFNETQLRDVALASLVLLSKQNLKDYGFEKAQLNPSTVLAVHTLGFETEEKRTAALKKWQEFRAKKP